MAVKKEEVLDGAGESLEREQGVEMESDVEGVQTGRYSGHVVP